MRIKLAFPVTNQEIAAFTGSVAVFDNTEAIEYITTDSREVKKGDLFVAIKGENFDGHSYIKRALELGASYALCERAVKDTDIKKLIICENTVLTLGDIAREYLSLHRVKTIAITGSVGKTTTKEFIYSVLSQKFKVHKTEGNHNNELGLPYTLLSMPADTEILITEMGMCNSGEIEYLSKIVKPDYAVVTVIGSSHLENLKTRENICAAKMEIACGMDKGGVLIVNGDEPLLRDDKYKESSAEFLSLDDNDSSYYAKNIASDDLYTTFDFICGEKCIKMKAAAIGRHIVWAASYATAIGLKFNMTPEEIRRGLLSYKTEKMRQNIYKIGEITVIDDCYNASPESMRAACDVLVSLARKNSSRALALLGDMKELGENSATMHEQVGEYMAKNGLSLLFTYGTLAESYAKGAVRVGMSEDSIFINNDTSYEKCGEALLSNLKAGDVLLVKASRAMAAEKIINYIAAHIS